LLNRSIWCVWGDGEGVWRVRLREWGEREVSFIRDPPKNLARAGPAEDVSVKVLLVAELKVRRSALALSTRPNFEIGVSSNRRITTRN